MKPQRQRAMVVMAIAVAIDIAPSLAQPRNDTIMLASSRNSWCLSDGGSDMYATSKFMLWPCNDQDSNQYFRYDLTTLSLSKPPNLRSVCLDDGGGLTAKTSSVRTAACNASSPTQQFELVSDSTSADEYQLRSKTKQLCVDDALSSTRLQLAPCNVSLHFTVIALSKAGPPPAPAPTIPTQVRNVSIADGYQALLSGEAVRIQSLATSLCIGSNAAAVVCNAADSQQLFQYNPNTLLLHQALDRTACLGDDNWSSHVPATVITATCNAWDVGQYWKYDEATKRVTNPYWNACLEMDMSAGYGYLTIQTCSTTQAKHTFALIPQSAYSGVILVDRDNGSVTAADKVAVATHVDNYRSTALAALTNGAKVMFRMPSHGLCLDSMGDTTAATVAYQLAQCDSTKASQQFLFDSSNAMLRSVVNQMCLDDMGYSSWSPTSLSSYKCDTKSQNQKFTYNEKTGRITSASKNKCAYTSNMVYSQGDHRLTLDDCANGLPFDVIALNATAAATASDPAYAALINGESVMIKTLSTSQCIGAVSTFASTCDATNSQLWFQYNSKTLLFHRAMDRTSCLSDGGGSSMLSMFSMDKCNVWDGAQYWIFEPSTKQLKNPTKNLCLSMGLLGLGSTQPCDVNDADQHFAIVAVSAYPSAHAPAADKTALTADELLVASTHVTGYSNLVSRAQQNGTAVMLRVDGGPLCVDIMSNSELTYSEAMQCDSSRATQWFQFDVAKSLIRSVANKLCLDDGGYQSLLATHIACKACDSTSTTQRFVFSQNASTLVNSAKNRCLEGPDEVSAALNDYRLSLTNCDSAAKVDLIMQVPTSATNSTTGTGGVSAAATTRRTHVSTWITMPLALWGANHIN